MVACRCNCNKKAGAIAPAFSLDEAIQLFLGSSSTLLAAGFFLAVGLCFFLAFRLVLAFAAILVALAIVCKRRTGYQETGNEERELLLHSFNGEFFNENCEAKVNGQSH